MVMDSLGAPPCTVVRALAEKKMFYWYKLDRETKTIRFHMVYLYMHRRQRQNFRPLLPA